MKLRTLLAAGIASLLTAVVVSQAQVPGVNSTLNSVFTLAYDNSTMKPTYSASASFTTPTTNAGGDTCSLYGSATKTIKVRRILVGGVGSALMTDPISVIKRSTASTTGTATLPTAVPYDSSNAAATAAAEVFTVVPTTIGTAVGTLADVYITIAGATTAVAQNQPQTLIFGQLGQPIVLRGVAQSVGVNTTGVSTFTMSCTFEWTEE